MTAIINKRIPVLSAFTLPSVKKITVAQVVENLRRNGAMDYTCVIAACASDRLLFNTSQPMQGAVSAIFPGQKTGCPYYL